MPSEGRKIHHVTLDAEERDQLQALVDSGTGSTERRTRAPILLLADRERAGGGRRDADIAEILGGGTATVERVRTHCVMAGVEAARARTVPVNRKQRLPDGAGAAKLTMRAGSEPPAGPAQWTLQLWPTGGWTCTSWRRSPDRQSGTLSRKRYQARVGSMRVPAAPGECGMCRRDGGWPGTVQPGPGRG